jgi:hypothetical protein
MNTRNPEVEKLLDQLNITKDTQILGDGGLIRELTKRLLERALEGEMTAEVPSSSTSITIAGVSMASGTFRPRDKGTAHCWSSQPHPPPVMAQVR